MDIERAKLLSIPKIEAGKMVSVVRKTIQEIKDAKQEKYEEGKEIYKPIVEKLKEEIEQISELREDFNKLDNRPLQQLDYIGDKPEALKQTHPMDKFTQKETYELKKYGYPMPSQIISKMKNNPKIIDDLLKKTLKDQQSISGKKGGKKVKTPEEKKYIRGKERFVQKYRERLKDIKHTWDKYVEDDYDSNLSDEYDDDIYVDAKEGYGLHYTQPKRNAYKITKGGKYGILKIDVPKLVGQLQLVAHKDGNKVLDKRVDFDTIDLLTKRFNTKKIYSDLSKRVFNELNSLSEIPIHRTSKKFTKIGSGVVYYHNKNDLLDRLELLGGAINAGNNGVVQEFSEIAHKLKSMKVLTDDQFKDIMVNYVV